MKRLVIFSSPKGKNFEEILEKIFPAEIKNKVLAYLPTHKKYLNGEFTNKWKEIAKKHNAEFRYVDVSGQSGIDERSKIEGANILVITGGNTFWLLDRLRKMGLEKTICEFAKKDEFVISGWSAGAIIMSPTIFVAGLPHRDGSSTSTISKNIAGGTRRVSPMDENNVGLTDLTGLNLVSFEIFPHYVEEEQKQTLENYRKETKNEVKALTDDEYIIIDL